MSDPGEEEVQRVLGVGAAGDINDPAAKPARDAEVAAVEVEEAPGG